jgi:hypothetical protein
MDNQAAPQRRLQQRPIILRRIKPDHRVVMLEDDRLAIAFKPKDES